MLSIADGVQNVSELDEGIVLPVFVKALISIKVSLYSWLHLLGSYKTVNLPEKSEQPK